MANRSKLMLLIFLFLMPFCSSNADVSPIIQISTHFKKIIGSPSWLIIIHDANSSAVYPYLFDLHENDNYFTIFTNASSYRLVSIMQFDFASKKIINFCNFPQTPISNESLDLHLSGTLTSDRTTSQCVIFKYKNMP